MAVTRVWGGIGVLSSCLWDPALSLPVWEGAVCCLWDPGRVVTSSLPASRAQRLSRLSLCAWAGSQLRRLPPSSSAGAAMEGAEEGPSAPHTPHTPLRKHRAVFNEKQQMGIAGKCGLPGRGRLMMSLNIVSVSVSHSCPFCRAEGTPLPRPVPWEEPSRQRGRSGR